MDTATVTLLISCEALFWNFDFGTLGSSVLFLFFVNKF